MLEAQMKALADWIKIEDGFTLVAHTSPDGDALGSSLALYGVLEAMGKRAQVVCECEVPLVYGFMPYAPTVVEPQLAKPEYRNIIAVDCADVSRMGSAQVLLPGAKAVAVIDHHRTNRGFGTYNVIDPEAAATGELIFALRRALGVPITRPVADCLYVAINTDTGNFSYSNTRPQTLNMAGALLECGVDVADINRRIYRTIPLSRLKLLGAALSGIKLYDGNRIGITHVSQAQLLECGAASEDAEGIIDNIRDVDTVEIAILIREAKDGTYKISLRSKQYADVCLIAQQFGGGGHEHAAGCTIELPFDETYARLLQAAIAALTPQ